MRSLAFFPLCLALCSLMLFGCATTTSQTDIAPGIETAFKGEYKVDPYLEDHMPGTVAILPFVDRSNSQGGIETVRRAFYNNFSALPYTHVELYRVDHLLKKAGLTDPEVIANTSPQKLGEILGADAVILGDISNFEKFYAVLYSQVAVGAEVKMFDTKSGSFLWSGRHVDRKHEGGLAASPVGIVATIVSTAMNIRDIQLLRACDDLFRGMVYTLPVPAIAKVTRPPAISLLTQDTKGVPKKAGDEIKVVIKGDPNRQASFDIGTFKRGIDMIEVEPGGYLGTHKVVPGENGTEAIVTAHLSDDSGNTVSWIDPGHGGFDPGAVGPTGPKEKDVTLDLAQRVNQKISETGQIKSFLTRTGDYYIPLSDRTVIANQYQADLFVSIHINASENRKAHGCETYFCAETVSSKEAARVAAFKNAVLKYDEPFKKKPGYIDIEEILFTFERRLCWEERDRFAQTFQGRFEETLPFKSRGVHSANFFVLRRAKMPSILLETGFISNHTEEAELQQISVRNEIAAAVVRGLLHGRA